MANENTGAERPLMFEEDMPEDTVGKAPPTDEEVAEQLKKAAKPQRVPDPESGGIPPWVRVPDGYRFAKRRVVFIKFPSRWTDTPSIGFPLPVEDEASIAAAGVGGLWRQCICVPLNVGDAKHAYGRAMQDQNRMAEELTKQMIRVVDGFVCDWSGAPSSGNIDVWWDQIGGPLRNLMNRTWSQLHTLDAPKLKMFFENCIVVRAAG